MDDKVLNQFFSSTQNPLSQQMHANSSARGYSPNDFLARPVSVTRMARDCSPMFGQPVRRSQSPSVSYQFMPSPKNVYSIEAEKERLKENCKPNYKPFETLA
jgi:hypothetical protein